jgi:hypothetical protein
VVGDKGTQVAPQEYGKKIVAQGWDAVAREVGKSKPASSKR